MKPVAPSLHIAIACGGTGGHLFPGLAVGREILARGGRVTLFISAKEVDREAVKEVRDMRVVTLPSVGLTRGQVPAFCLGLWRSYRLAKREFNSALPRMVLGMGGFTSAGPILAGRRLGAACFLHDSNVIPGRANRWLARFADEVFLGTDAARVHLKAAIRVTGTPVRPEFQPRDAVEARRALGLRTDDPVLLVMGGSQGAAGINRLVLEALPALVERLPRLQFMHLTGATDLTSVQAAYTRLGVKANVMVFCAEMHQALGAATLAVSRAGGSTLAELVATETPAVLIPLPTAADNHQHFNAQALADAGAAVTVNQNHTGAGEFAGLLRQLLTDPVRLEGLRGRLNALATPHAAAAIVDAMYRVSGARWSSGIEARGEAGTADSSSFVSKSSRLPAT